ncbi:MAG: heme-binding protein [Planctomycetota bacterium]
MSISRRVVAALLVAAAPLALAGETDPAQIEPTMTKSAEPTQEPYVAEASLPEGFPMPGPAEVVTLKPYPAYRVAVAHGSAAFWKLFGHIQRQNIPMTAPVTMSHTAQGDAPLDGDAGSITDPLLDRDGMTMGFLYPATSVGELGDDHQDASVAVQDVPPMTVLSYGFFGPPRGDRLDQARQSIDAARQADHPDLVFAGSWRLLGYNGPSVPADRRYYEVQRPVEPKPIETDQDPAPAPTPEN